jgi:hypothetical protein
MYLFQTIQNNIEEGKDGAMANRNYIKPNKITLATWVDKALEQSPTNKTSNLDLRVCGIWLLNPKVMEHRIDLLDMHNINNK